MIRHVQLRELEPWSHVALIGEFNNWSTTATPLECVDGIWQAVVDLPPGKSSYDFFVIGYDEFGQPWSDVVAAKHELASQAEPEMLLAS